MKSKFLLLIVSVFLLSSVSMAAPLCVADTMSNYISLGSGGCQIGSLIFSDFGFSTSGNASIGEAGVTVTPEVAGGLTFNGTFGTTTGGALYEITYLATTTYGGIFYGVGVSAVGTSSAGGSVGFLKEINSLDDLELLAAGGAALGSGSTLSISGAPTIASVVDQISVFNSSSSVSSVTNSPFQVVPEPMTMSLIGLGLVGLGLGRRFKFGRR